MPPLVSVIVANWNGRHFLERCLASLAAQTYPAVEVIVVDNGSTDGSPQWLRDHHPTVQLICNARNLGFAAANNQGMAQAHGAYVALLNNDAWADAGWLAALVTAAEADERIGMAASLMLSAAQPDRVDSAGICVDRCGISWDRAGGEPEAALPRQPVAVFGASGGAALYRRQLLDESGGFDVDFFAYLEDVDLAWRARWLGWQAVLVPAARVFHVHSGTSREGSTFKTYWLARNKILMLLKCYPLPQLWLYAPLIILYDLFSLVNSLIAQRSLSSLRGRLAGWRTAGAALAKRRALHAQRARSPGPAHVSAAEVFQWLAPVALPWRVQRRYAHLAPTPAPTRSPSA